LKSAEDAQASLDVIQDIARVSSLCRFRQTPEGPGESGVNARDKWRGHKADVEQISNAFDVGGSLDSFEDASY
jgi:hypothetical protein